MYLFLIGTLLVASGLASSDEDYYSFSRSVGRGSGDPFAIKGEGRISAVRLWEHNNAYIAGIQLRYGFIWSKMVGRTVGTMIEMELFDDERIIQVSGKYHTSNYIYQLHIVTSRGRFLLAGQPTALSFNMYPVHMDAGLKMLSGRADSNGITALAAHWDMINEGEANKVPATL